VIDKGLKGVVPHYLPLIFASNCQEKVKHYDNCLEKHGVYINKS
jgi:hypothetical protein